MLERVLLQGCLLSHLVTCFSRLSTPLPPSCFTPALPGRTSVHPHVRLNGIALNGGGGSSSAPRTLCCLPGWTKQSKKQEVSFLLNPTAPFQRCFFTPVFRVCLFATLLALEVGSLQMSDRELSCCGRALRSLPKQ